MSDHPLAAHAFLSDCHSSALVTDEGSVDWLTFPRFDAPSVLGRLLDEDAGHFRIAPTGTVRECARRYVDHSLVLETTWTTDTGRVRCTDGMPVGVGERGHDLGTDAPHALLRHVECRDGEVEMRVEYAPRPEYGRARPLLRAVDGGLETLGGPDRLVLATDVDLDVDAGTATATVTLRAGECVSFALQWARSWEDVALDIAAEDVQGRLTDTVAAWTSWASQHQNYEGRWQDLVVRSGSVLQGLTFQPTGAIVAAPTTSLPEVVGGGRNWDYRYAWLRDAAMTLDALWVAACPDEAEYFVRWLVGAGAGEVEHGAAVQIMYGVGGEHDLSERTLDHLGGWRDSRPVRIGNGAFDQVQHDVHGAVLDAVVRLRDQLVPFEPETIEFLIALADTAADVWHEPDQGIWEVRGGPQHHLYSALMCWVALDRALELAHDLAADDKTMARWDEQRGEIRDAILERGFDDDLQAFTQTLDGDALDASALRISLVGLLPGDDPRMLSTIEAVERDLTDDDGFVRRYRTDDGLGGEEGAFLLCTFWLAHAHALAGNLDRAKEVFDLAVSVRSDLGLLAEEVNDGELLGNYPQAFSHIGLVTAAWAIHQAEQATDDAGRAEHPATDG